MAEDIIEEKGQFLAVEVAASVTVVLGENLLNELLKFLISNHIYEINISIISSVEPDKYPFTKQNRLM